MTTSSNTENFAAWASAVGLRVSPEHLELLRPEVEAMLTRLAGLDDIDVSEVTIEQAIGGIG